MAWIGWRRGHPFPWAAVSLAALVLGMVFLRRAGRTDRGESTVTIDDLGVTRSLSGGRVESVRWDDLAEVQIVTTDAGPFTDDVFWLLIGKGGAGCAVPSEAPGAKDLLARLQELPGFDNEAVIAAMTSTSNARFHVWKLVN